MSKFNLMLISSLMFFGLLVSCEKEGPVGPQGVAGEQGPKGDQGETGTTNVIYSDWFTPSSYTKSTLYSVNNFTYDKVAAGITQEILDNGVVLTYGNLEGYNTAIWPKGQVSQLPITVTYVQGEWQTDTWSAFATEGNLRITFINNTNFYAAGPVTTHHFRYVIIPGGLAARRSDPISDFSDYHAVCEYYGIPE